MTSNDVFIVIGGQSYRLDGEVLRPTETPFQREVLRRLDGVEAEQKELRSELRELRAEQKDLRAEVKVLAENQAAISGQIERIDSQAAMTLWVIGIGFALMTVVLGVIGLLPTLWAGRKNEASPKPEPTSYRDIRDIVRTELELLGIRKG